MSFGVQCDGGLCIFEILVNEERVNFNSFFFQSENKWVSVPLYQGKNNITFAFQKVAFLLADVLTTQLTATRNSDHLMIFAMEIDGAAIGGAAHCLPCPIGTLGTRPGLDRCRPCSSGNV